MNEKLSKTPKKSCLFHACPRIPEMRDPSKWKFLKRGIPQNRNFQNEGSFKSGIPETRELYTSLVLQEISSFYQCFPVLIGIQKF
jgi:hypothetical protein